ncbi:Uncharacterised protein [Streptococcus pneumoniae]|nr:Uncharacterised protein [Streptococcus pneumoniae]
MSYDLDARAYMHPLVPYYRLIDRDIQNLFQLHLLTFSLVSIPLLLYHKSHGDAELIQCPSFYTTYLNGDFSFLGIRIVQALTYLLLDFLFFLNQLF